MMKQLKFSILFQFIRLSSQILLHLIFNSDHYLSFLICQYQNLDHHFQMLCHFLKYQIANLAIKISSVCYHEQNSSLLFHSILQENMSLYQKLLLKYDTDYFIKTSFSWLLSTRSHSVYHAVKQDHFSSRFHWQYFSFDYNTSFLAISFITNEHMFF